MSLDHGDGLNIVGCVLDLLQAVWDTLWDIAGKTTIMKQPAAIKKEQIRQARADQITENLKTMSQQIEEHRKVHASPASTHMFARSLNAQTSTFSQRESKKYHTDSEIFFSTTSSSQGNCSSTWSP